MMDLRRVIARNVIWNWAGQFLLIGTALVLTPFLVGRLGDTTYGVWILIGSWTGYFGVLDLGVRGSVGRYVAYYRAKGDQEGVNRTVSTALAMLCVQALLALAGTVGSLGLFFLLFPDVPPDQVPEVRLALLLVGLNLALNFPLGVFEGTLWGYQRFDLLNAIDIPVILARLGLTLYFVGQGHSLVAMALINLLVTLVGAAARVVFTFREDRALRVGRPLVKLALARDLFGYGIWSLLLVVGALIATQMSPLIIGNQISIALVTIYSIVVRLIYTAKELVVASTGVLTPVATSLHAADDHGQQRRLFIEGGKYCQACALLFLGLFVFLGRPLLDLWMGRSLKDPAQLGVAFDLLVVFALGQMLPMSQWITHSMILAMNRHRFMALVGIAEIVVATGLAFALARPYGLLGVCGAFIGCEVVCRGVIKFLYACRLVGVPWWQYVTQALLLPLVPATVPLLGMAALAQWWVPRTWPELIVQGAAFTFVFAAASGLLLVGWERIRSLVQGIVQRMDRTGEMIEGDTV
jgi:O-antigen/teichoic acid export membrane protein